MQNAPRSGAFLFNMISDVVLRFVWFFGARKFFPLRDREILWAIAREARNTD